MDTPQTADRPIALWNPNAAAAWSLLFTPVFGAWLHAMNWRALGDAQRERSSLAWAAGGAVILLVYLLIDTLSMNRPMGDEAERVIAGLFLVIWYFASARAQSRLVRERFGGNFERKSWRRPLLLALAAFGIYVALAVAIAAVIGFRNL
jgi:hypothetical protein